MKTALFATALVCCTFASDTFAIAPESGMYWQPDRSGRGFYIEHQNGRVGIAIYAFHRDTGAAEIYVSGGVLRDDGPFFPVIPDPPLSPEGQFPVHLYVGDLLQASHG